MKQFVIAVCIGFLTSCAQPADVKQKILFVLPNSQFKVDDQMTDFAQALTLLGEPRRTQVVLTLCSDLPVADLQKAKVGLERAGFKDFIFAQVEDPHLELCVHGP